MRGSENAGEARAHGVRRPAARALVGTGVLALTVAVLAAQGAARAERRAQQPAPSPPDPRPAAGQTQAAPPSEPQQPPVFRTGINVVRVDVIVTDKQGNPVADLGPKDFELLEDGKAQTIDTFKLVSVTGSPAPGEEAPRAIRNDYDEETEAGREDVRIFVIMLDEYQVRRGASLVVREPLVRFIRTQLGPLDLLGIMYPLTPVSGLRLTRNHEAVVREIERFVGRKYEYTPKNEFEERYSMYPAEVVERIRVQVSLSALRGLVTRLGGLREGRKAVILVSEGYSYYVPPQLRDPVAEMKGLGNPARGRPMAGEGSLAEERAQFTADIDLQTDLREVYAAASRANAAIYALDPRGLATFAFDIDEGVGFGLDRNVLAATQDTLRVLADETDGRAIVNRNDLDGGLKQVVRDSSAYYLIGYNSTLAPTDGKFHEIKVRVKRPGVQVRARKGYWALSAEDTARVLAPKPAVDDAVTNALAEVEAPRRARIVRTWVGAAPGEGGRTRVTFVWEPVTAAAGERTASAARVALVASGRDGEYFRGKVEREAPLDAATSGAGAASAAAAAAGGGRAEFEAAPGKMQLRLAIEGGQGQVIDSDLMDVEVPDFTAPQVQLSTPQVLRASTPRDVRALNANPRALPTGVREFRRTERLLVRFSARAPGNLQAEPKARLLNRAGQPMSDLPVLPVPGDPSAWQVDLPLAGLAAGQYVLEVSASAGGAEAKQHVGFRVYT